MIFHDDILNISRSIGFDLCGVTTTQPLTRNVEALQEWIAAGNVSRLDYMCRNIDKRADTTLLFPGAQSIIVCGISYKSSINQSYTPSQRGKIASYACNRDYHKSIKKMLNTMLSEIQRLYPNIEGRTFVDSAPLFEKQLAVNAGLGWIGKQSLLISPIFGSYILLGEIVLNDEVSRYDQPIEHIGCAECRRCIDACPNNAINTGMTIDARRCISCQTIEQSDNDHLPLHGWIFGCDECQMCCPYNIHSSYHTHPAFDPLFDPTKISVEQWLDMSDEDFIKHFGSTPMKRSGLQRIKDAIQK